MTIKELFEKAKTENGALTYDEFEALAKSSGAKFADLGEGQYVSKQKYLDELATKDTEITTLKETIQGRESDLATLQEQLKAAGTDSAKLEELTANLTSLQSKYDADTQALQGKLNAQAYEFAVRDFAAKQKFSSSAARRDFEAQLLQKNLPMEKGSILGADDFAKAYAKDNSDAFVKETKAEPESKPKPQFASSATGDKKSGAKMTLSEMMAAKNENPDFVINFD